MLSAEFLGSVPISGTHPEKAFDAYGHALRVKFTDTNDHERYAVFGCASAPCREIIIPGADSCCVVIADGKAYWVDDDERR